MAEHLTPEKIEQGRKLLERMTAGEWFRTGPLSDEEACRAGGVAAGLVACFDDTIPEDSEVNLLDELQVQDIDGIAWLRNNAPALLAAAELGMAWEAEAKAARKVEEYTPGFDQIDARIELAKARLHTDQLTGRIGSAREIVEACSEECPDHSVNVNVTELIAAITAALTIPANHIRTPDGKDKRELAIENLVMLCRRIANKVPDDARIGGMTAQEALKHAYRMSEEAGVNTRPNLLRSEYTEGSIPTP